MALFALSQKVLSTLRKLRRRFLKSFIIWALENIDYNGETLMMAPLASFYSQPGHGVDEVRIAYVLNADDMEKSMKVLAEALKAYPGRK